MTPSTSAATFTALVVDDEPHIRAFFRIMLMDIGLETVLEARNGFEAVATYEEKRPDLVLMDINMNKLDGLKALEAIRFKDQKAAVIMITSVSARDAIEESKSYGAIHYILKTEHPEQIKSQVNAIIETLKLTR